jgi:RNA polymerase sigma factor (sigma-70 family)
MVYMKFDDLVTKLTPTIKKIAYRLNGRYRVLDHDDLYQEALLHLWHDFCAGKLDEKTDSYILQGCYFYLKNHLRSVEDNSFFASLDEEIGEDDTTLQEMIPDDGPDEDEALETRLAAEAVMGCGLDDREKTVLKLYADGFTAREVGEMVGVSHVTVVKTIERIREKAKKLVQHI